MSELGYTKSEWDDEIRNIRKDWERGDLTTTIVRLQRLEEYADLAARVVRGDGVEWARRRAWACNLTAATATLAGRHLQHCDCGGVPDPDVWNDVGELDTSLDDYGEVRVTAMQVVDEDTVRLVAYAKEGSE